MWISNYLCSTMYRNSIITIVILILILEQHAFASPMSKSACFTRSNGNNNASWCHTNLMLCGNASFAYNMSVSLTEFQTGNEDKVCLEECINQDNSLNQDKESPVNSEVLSKCNGQNNCSLADIIAPQSNKGGILQLSFFCNDTEIDEKADNITTSTLVIILTTTVSQATTSTTGTLSTTFTFASTTSGPTTGNSTTSLVASTTPIEDSGLIVAQSRTDDPFPAAIVVSFVIPAIIALVVVAVMMYRRGKCKLRIVKCTERYDKHSPNMTDAYAMNSTANVGPTYNVSRDVDVNGCDVNYCEIDMVRTETDSEYSHVNLEKKQAVHDPTYNHIGHVNSSSGNTDQTYNHVGDETLQKTDSSTLQPDMYSHIGTMKKPASGQLVEDSYAHINGVLKNPTTYCETKQYDVAVFQSTGGPTGGFVHQEREIFGNEKKFKVVGPSNVDSNNEAPVSHSYFILEKREKDP